jgi:hypothetical protein
MRNPPNIYVLLALGAIFAFALPVMKRKLMARNMSSLKALIISWVFFLIFAVVVLKILELSLGL